MADIRQPDRAVMLIKADSSTMEGMEFWPGIPAIPETCQVSLTGHGICLAAGTPRDLIWDLSISCNLVCGAAEEEEEDEGKEEEEEGGYGSTTAEGSAVPGAPAESTALPALPHRRSCCGVPGFRTLPHAAQDPARGGHSRVGRGEPAEACHDVVAAICIVLYPSRALSWEVRGSLAF